VTAVDHLCRFVLEPGRADTVVRWLHALCVVAALAAGVVLLDDRLRFLPDEQDYLTLALGLAQNGTFSLDGAQPTAFRPPGYAWLLAAAALVSTKVAFLKAVNLVLWLLAAWLTGRIARRLAGPLAEAAALILVLGYPALLYSATTLYPQTMAWLLCAFLGWLAVRPTHGVGAVVAGGAAGALLVLTVPNLMPIVLAYVAMILWRGGPGRWGKALLAVALVAAGIGLWTARNYQVFGEFVPLSTNSGMNLYMGNSPGTAWDSGVESAAGLDDPALSVLSEPARNRALMQRALDWIAAEPAAFLRLTALKLANWFNFRNRMTSGSPLAGAQDLVMFASFYTILGLALVRLAMLRSIPLQRWEVAFLAAYALVAAGYALFFTRIRFRLPVDFIPIVAAAVLAATLARRAAAGRSAARAVPAELAR